MGRCARHRCRLRVMMLCTLGCVCLKQAVILCILGQKQPSIGL